MNRFLVALLIVCALPASAGTRSAAERLAFQREHPCPSTGQRRGSCPNFVIDHVRPLCANGPDKASNMAWQSRADALEKDKLEWKECRDLRRRAMPPKTGLKG